MKLTHLNVIVWRDIKETDARSELRTAFAWSTAITREMEALH